MIKALIRIIFLGAALALASCDQTSLPKVSMLPSAATNPRSSSASQTEEADEFAATGAECGIDRREVATMVYLPMGSDLGEGILGCVLLRAPARVRNAGLHDRLWTISRALIPDGDEFRIERFILAQDGRTDTLAFVATLDDQGRSWEYGINLQDLNLLDRSVFEELLSTIIHEYAHILTLNETQVTYDSALLDSYTDMEMSDAEYEALLVEVEADCSAAAGVFDGEACFMPGSYLFDFYRGFWDWYGEDALELAFEGTLFEDYGTDFVNDYAATSPTEDFAESFAAWLMPEHEAFLITETVEDKFAFFESQPELMTLRAQIEAGLDEVRAGRFF